MKTIAIIIAVLVGMFIGVGGILPALAKLRDTGGIPGTFVGSYTLGVFSLTLLGAGSVFHLIARRKVV